MTAPAIARIRPIRWAVLAPICTLGPSRPSASPEPIASRPPKNFTQIRRNGACGISSCNTASTCLLTANGMVRPCSSPAAARKAGKGTAKTRSTPCPRNAIAQSPCLRAFVRCESLEPLMTAWGQLHALPRRSIAVRSTPISRPRQDGFNGTLCAKTGLMHCSNTGWPIRSPCRRAALLRPLTQAGPNSSTLSNFATRLGSGSAHRRARWMTRPLVVARTIVPFRD
jgi:hypothetical protein